MSHNLYMFKWKNEYTDPKVRKAKGIKFSHVVEALAENQEHACVTDDADISILITAITNGFGLSDIGDPDNPFIVERYSGFIVLNYGDSVRLSIVPKLDRIGKELGYVSCEG